MRWGEARVTCVLGIDAAWTKHNPSGVALVAKDQAQPSTWRLIAAEPSYEHFLARAAGGTPPRLPAMPADDAGDAAGDWVGAVITPWFINLFLLPGGGNLWSDLASGERCHINFPIGPLEFIADYNVAAEVPAYQYCPLFAPPGQIVSQTAARAAATARSPARYDGCSATRSAHPGRRSAPPTSFRA